jgi:hypothetical protein
LGLGPGDLAEGVVVGLVQAPAEQLQPLGDQRLLDRSAGLLGGLGVAERKATATRATRGTRRRGGPAAGLAEIGRVLRPDAWALIWDFRPGVRPHLFGPRHPHLPDPVQHARGTPLRVVNATPWPSPWRFTITQRVGQVRADGSPSLHPR